MGMMSLVLKQAAAACLPARGGGSLLLSSVQIDFADAAKAGEIVQGRARTTRHSRTLVFVRGELTACGRTTATGSAVFRVVSEGGARAAPAQVAPRQADSPADYVPYPLKAPFSNHAGPIFARANGEGEECAMRVLPHHLESGSATVADGAVLLLADLALGRCARHAVRGRRCVTLCLQLARHGEARLGDILVAQPRHQGRSADIEAVAADFVVGDSAVMSALGTWKVLPD